MRIISFKIDNYKSFYSTEEFNLAPGFNLIVGRNNVGKSALAELLGLQINDKPHKSLKTISYPGAVPAKSISQVNISFEVGVDEFINVLKDFYPNFYVPLVSSVPEDIQKDKFIEKLSKPILIKCNFQSGQFVSAYIDGYGKPESFSRALHFIINRSDSLPKFQGIDNSNINSILNVMHHLRTRIYHFKAERLNVGQSKIGTNEILSPDASNLPGVLNFLQSRNPNRFRRLNQLIHTVFPEIIEITIPPMQNDPSSAQIFIWTIDPKKERDDLAMPLSESGTGIGQVLSILYVVSTSDYSRTIIIDEPQSFLHPGAIRKLFEILKQHPQHQYIITTHSPTVVTSADPEKLLLIHKIEAESIIEILDTADNQTLRLFLSEVGARFSDVFGADNILWVEGDTEALCYPLILSGISKCQLLGTAIVGIIQTGDLQGRYKKTVLEIYERLSQGRGLLPPAIGFILDREGRTDSERKDLERQSKGSVHFLPRRMYENYLLFPPAIASVMSSLEGFRNIPIEILEIEKWLKHNKWNAKYFIAVIDEADRLDNRWLIEVDGATILKDMFNEFSETRYTYGKLEYGVLLTKWLIEHEKTKLIEIADLLKLILEEGRK